MIHSQHTVHELILSIEITSSDASSENEILSYGKSFRKRAEDSYPQKIFAHQLVAVDDLFQFKKELVQELLTPLKSQPD